MCHHTVEIGGRTIQSCMASITSEDVIRGIEKYYEGNIYRYLKIGTRKELTVTESGAENQSGSSVSKKVISKFLNRKKEINIIASLQSSGGGEQSARSHQTKRRI